MNKEVYEMNLHDMLFIEELDMRIMRVPGGWIYYQNTYTSADVYDMPNSTETATAVFVPYNRDFFGPSYN